MTKTYHVPLLIALVSLLGCNAPSEEYVRVHIKNGTSYAGTIVQEDSDTVTVGVYETVRIEKDDIRQQDQLKQRPVWTARAQQQPSPAAPSVVAAPPVPDGLQVGAAPPPFTLTDLHGQEESLEAYKGKPVVLHFWASWCPFCRRSIPDITKLHEREADGSIRLLTISTDQSEDTLRSFVEENKLPYTVIHSPTLGREYLVRGIPTTIVIDQEGIIRDVQSGFGTGFIDVLDELL